ncbi:MAG: hypothetical protein JRM82_03880 [Nitrososphaerota archaeon]|nr:hypothetical protein [Nitrososphaerota archaeon]
MPAVEKVRVGISFEEDLVRVLDKHIGELKELGVNRSEAVNAVVSEFLEEGGTTEAVWEAVARMRAKRRSG